MDSDDEQYDDSERMDTSQSEALDETRAVYNIIVNEITDTIAEKTFQDSQRTGDSQDLVDLGARILDTAKKLPQVQACDVKDPEHAREETEGFMAATTAMSETVFQCHGGVIDKKPVKLTEMILSTIGKSNGDMILQKNFIELGRKLFGKTGTIRKSRAQYLGAPSFRATRGTIDSADWQLPRNLTMTEYHGLAKKLGITLKNDVEHKRFNETISKWSEEEFVAKKSLLLRKVHAKGGGTNQNINENKDETQTNRDEQAQKHILNLILVSFNQDHEQPMDYWETVISDTFSGTVENIFYMSFLLKQRILTAWNEEGSVLFVPNYTALDNSKFGRKYTQGNEKNKSRVKYQAKPECLAKSKKFLADAEKTFQKLERKNVQANEQYQKMADSNYIGGFPKASPQGVIGITPKQWKAWYNYLNDDPDLGPEGWKPFLYRVED